MDLVPYLAHVQVAQVPGRKAGVGGILQAGGWGRISRRQCSGSRALPGLLPSWQLTVAVAIPETSRSLLSSISKPIPAERTRRAFCRAWRGRCGAAGGCGAAAVRQGSGGRQGAAVLSYRYNKRC